MPTLDTALILRSIEQRLPETRVLIIDRTARSREALTQMLQALGINEISLAASAAEALALTQSQPFDVYFSEHRLEEGKDGHQLLETLRQQGLPRTAVYFVLSTERSHAQVMSIAELVPDDYLIKPFNTAQLQTRLLQAMYRKHHVLREVFTALDRHDYQAAIDACNRIPGEFPSFHLETLRIKGDLLNILGLHSAAELLYTEVIRDKPLPWARRGLAQALFEKGRLDEAARVAGILIQENPDYLATYDFLAHILDLQGHPEAAQKTLSLAADKSPLNSKRYKAVGEFAVRNRDWETAARSFSNVLERKRGTPLNQADDYGNLALVLLEQKNIEGVRRVLAKLRRELKEDPLNGLVGPMLEGLCDHADGKVSANEHIKAAVIAHQRLAQSQNPIPPRLSCDLAHACLTVGETEPAHNLLRTVASAYHDTPQVIAHIKSIFARHQQAEAGQTVLDQASREIIELNNRGVLAAQTGDLRKSAEMLIETAEQVPNVQFLVNAAKAIFTLLNREGWNETLAKQGLLYLRRAWAQDRSSSKVSSARAQYVQTATRYGQPVEPF